MNAFVLAAGVGSRLRPYTDTVPKPMLDIGGEPILAYAIRALVRSGFRDLTLNLHYLPDVVRAYVGDGHRFGALVHYSDEPELRGTAGALIPVASRFRRGTFAVVFGDNVIDVDIEDVLAAHWRRGAVATVAVWERDDVRHSGVAELDDSDRIVRFIEKPAPGTTTSHWVNAGVIIGEPAVLDAIPETGPSDFGRDVLPALVRTTQGVYAYRMRGGLWWFDRPEDLVQAREDPALLEYLQRVRGHAVDEV